MYNNTYILPIHIISDKMTLGKLASILLICLMMCAGFAGCISGEKEAAPDNGTKPVENNEPRLYDPETGIVNPDYLKNVSEDDMENTTIDIDDNNTGLFSRPGPKAVLIVGGAGKDSNNARYWNEMVWMWDILVLKYNYSVYNIATLYANGKCPDEDNVPDSGAIVPHINVITCPAKKKNLSEICTLLALKIKPDEQLFVWSSDHGTNGKVDATIPPTASPANAALCLWGENIDDDEFAGPDHFGKVKNYSKRIFAMEQCLSGGFIDDLSAEKTIIMTACTDLVFSWGGAGSGGYPYDVWCFLFQAALNGAFPDGTKLDADSNKDGKISMKEAFDYAFNSDMMDYPTAAEIPQLDDNGNKIGNDPQDGAMAAETFL